jgi:hypothetical protein
MDIYRLLASTGDLPPTGYIDSLPGLSANLLCSIPFTSQDISLLLLSEKIEENLNFVDGPKRGSVK